jgi:acetoin utilization deacetylase AcuC-like enzyme
VSTEQGDAARVGLVYADRYLQHNPGLYVMGEARQPAPFVDPILHPSNHRLVMRTKQLLDLTGLSERLTPLAAYPASVDDVAVYHTRSYIDFVRELCAAGGGDTGEGAPASVESYEIALLAAGGGMAAVDAVMNGRVRRAFANVRPPGHHAMASKGMGYCVFNNVVIAARHAQRRHGVRRVMIVDWDVHHGNGTQDAFYDDPDVLFISLHQDQLYPPGYGDLEQVGAGAGEGFTVNLPLPAGCGDAAYRSAFERVVLPIAAAFEPQLVLVSAGQDASTMDPLGRMCVTTAGYRQMTQALIDVAERHADGKLVILQEGGYSELYAPYCTLAIIETLAGIRTGIIEPQSIERLQAQPQYSTVGLSAEAAIAAICQTQARYWNAVAPQQG